MMIRLASLLQTDSIIDGDGIRTVLWTQGCIHNCKGCHNPSTHSFQGGYLEDVEVVKQQLSSLKYQDGVTLSGGDPMCQPEACLEIVKHCKLIGLNVWCYTGYTYEQLLELSKKRTSIMELLNYIDVLVDGKFILEQKSYDVKFRGSKNQRLIDMKKTLEQGFVVEHKYEDNSVSCRNHEQEYIFV